MKFLNNIEAEKNTSIEFKTSTNESRKLYWDNLNRTLSIEIGNGIIQQIGQEQQTLVRNTSQYTITNGTLVMVVGTVGESAIMIVAPAVTNGVFRAEYIAGILTEDIGPGEDGIVTTFGMIHDIDTTGGDELWETGTVLYPNPLIPGKLTSITPEAPNLFIPVGIVTYSDALNGSIFVRMTTGNYLRSSHDVQVNNLNEADILYYNELNSRWENVPLSELAFIASQSSVEDVGDYYQETNVESILQEIGAHTNIQDLYIADLLSTGVYEFSGITKIDDTHFSIGAAKGYIVDNTTDHENPVISHINYAGSDSILATNIGVSYQTQVFLQSDGTLYFESIDIPTCPSRRDRIFLGRVVHPSTIITAVEALPDFIQSPAAQLRDLWKGLGAINDKNYVYSNNTPSTNLSLALQGGTIYYNGINFVTNKKRPTRKTIASQLLLTFNYRTRTGAGANGLTVLDPTQYDDNGTLTTVPQPGATATNQRVFLAPSGLVLIQYGQQHYSNLAEAIAGLPSESFIKAPGIETNAILIGIISISKDATNLTSTYAKFHSISKFGELGGGGSGVGAAVAAQDVVVADAGNYFTSSNTEDVLQEIGYSINNAVTVNTITVLEAGTAISLTSLENPTDTITYTVSHDETSPLSGAYGMEGIKSITVDDMGHVTGVQTETYLKSTTQSKDFGTILVTDNNTGYTWSDSGSVVSDTNADTITFVSGDGIEVNADSTADAIEFVNIDKGSSQAIFKSIAVAGQDTVVAEINNDTITLVAGDYISITTDAINDSITIGTTGLSLDWAAIQNKPDPTITLGGDLSGSVTLTDLASGTLSATINANSVTLGTDTTGNYVSTITQGSGIVVTGGTGEESTPTIAHADTSSQSSIVTLNSNGNVVQDISLTFDTFGHVSAASTTSTDLDDRYYTKTNTDLILGSYQLVSALGQPDGYVPLDSNSKILNDYLTSDVFEINEYANLSSFPTNGETGKLYVALDTNKLYRWSGAVYIAIASGSVDSVGGYTGVISASNLLTAIETVDGAESGLDSDLLDGQHGSYYSPINSPTLTGSPKAPTPSVSDSTTSIATTSYVVSRIAQDSAPIAHVGVGGTAHSLVNDISNGFMSSTDKIKLDSVASGAEVNVNADWSVSSGDAQILNKPTTLSGYGITDATPSSHIGATGTAHGDATTSTSGFMSATDKTKLNGIAAGAEVNVNADWNASSGDAQILNKPTLGTSASKNTGTSSGQIPILDSNGKLDTTILPALAISDTFVIASENAMLALTAEVGDIAVRSDLNKSFILKTDGANILANWQELLTPTDSVLSVNNKTGAVSLTYSDVGAEPTISTKNTAFNKNYGTTSTDVKMNGVQAVGSIDEIARIDHIHPTDTSRAASSHAHGNITTDGKIGSTADLIIKTTTSGVLTTLAAGSAGQFLAHNGAWATPVDTTYTAGNGLTLTGTDFNVVSASGTAGSVGTLSVTADSVGVSLGTTSTTACVGNDSRLSDARTPTSHIHGNITNAGAIGSTADLIVKTTTGGALTTLAAGSAGQFLANNGTWATPPDTNTTYTAGNGMTLTGTEFAVASAEGIAGSVGTLVIEADVIGVSLGATSTTACAGNDSRLSDARTPTSHTHGNITNAGAIGTTANLAVLTGVDGVLTTGTIPLTTGGTGATTAVGALTNLGLTATASELNLLDGELISTTELNYLSGVTSAIQTQINGKAASSHNHDASNITSGTLSGDRGVTAGSTSASFVKYSGTTATAGQFDGGTTVPTGTTRLNYGGYLYATKLYSGASEVYTRTSFASGGSTFNSTTGVVIAHSMGAPSAYSVLVTPTSNGAGYIGEWYVVKGTNTMTVYCTGSTTTTTFDYFIKLV